MPEHRAHTPPALRNLESFLWWDFTDGATWAAWVVARGGDHAAADASFEEALRLQAVLRELEAANNGAPPSRQAWERLDRFFETAGLRPRVTQEGEVGFAHHAGPVGHVLTLVLEALVSGAWRRFKTCRDADCRASFFDASRNSSMTWCSMETCGARSKMRRYRASSSTVTGRR